MGVEELLERIRALEAGQAELKREVSDLMPERHGGAVRSHRPTPASRTQRLGRVALSLRHHRLIMQSLGQAVHILDPQGKVLYWNRHAEHLYGYSASEAIGQDITKLIINPWDICALNSIIGNIFKGKCWRGRFPVRNKQGDRFYVAVDATPLYDDDDDGSLVVLFPLGFMFNVEIGVDQL
ncbi:hypothetical protein EJB05_47965, partial [Eragrostis curvula]